MRINFAFFYLKTFVKKIELNYMRIIDIDIIERNREQKRKKRTYTKPTYAYTFFVRAITKI